MKGRFLTISCSFIAEPHYGPGASLRAMDLLICSLHWRGLGRPRSSEIGYAGRRGILGEEKSARDEQDDAQ